MALSGLVGTPQSDVHVGMVTGKVLQFPSCLYLMPEKILNNIVSLCLLLHNPHRLCGAFRCTGVQNLIGLELIGKPLRNLLKLLPLFQWFSLWIPATSPYKVLYHSTGSAVPHILFRWPAKYFSGVNVLIQEWSLTLTLVLGWLTAIFKFRVLSVPLTNLDL